MLPAVDDGVEAGNQCGILAARPPPISACASSRRAGETREMFSGNTMSRTRLSLSFAISAAYASMALNARALSSTF